jgi:hypothetical protein
MEKTAFVFTQMHCITFVLTSFTANTSLSVWDMHLLFLTNITVPLVVLRTLRSPERRGELSGEQNRSPLRLLTESSPALRSPLRLTLERTFALPSGLGESGELSGELSKLMRT